MRVTAAVVTERWPIFPAYYYTDAKLEDAAAWDMALAWRQHRDFAVDVSPSQRADAVPLAALYLLLGRRPIAGKLFNAVLGAAAVIAVCGALAPAFGWGAALASAVVIAVWPSHVFYTSQNFKESSALLFCWAALAALAPFQLMPRFDRTSVLRVVGGCASLVLVGFLRAYLLLTLVIALCAGAAVIACRARGRGRLAHLAMIPLLLASLGVYTVARGIVYNGPFRARGLAPSRVEGSLIVHTYDTDHGDQVVTPWSPEGITATRRLRQASEQYYSRTMVGRRVETQLFPDAQFHSWLDVIRFLPKGAFYVLFMPLPVVYPSDGRIGRILASAENAGLLLLALLAVLGLARRTGSSAGQATFAAFFILMTCGSAVLEFDLGSATRHKLNYLPALFPFAFSYLFRRRQPRERRLKVMQVLECGGPGGTGNQVVALCNALAKDRLETQLVYNVRPGCDPDAFRKSASGATQAFRIESLSREISPVRDLSAFWALYRLFKREQPDVVHLHSSKAGAVGRPAAWLAGVPRIFYTPHGYGFLQQDRGALSRALYKLAELSVSWIGTVVAVSPSEAAFAKPLAWGNRVETVCDPYLGELPPSNDAPPRKETLVGACGRLTGARQPGTFVNLAQRVTDSRNDLKCVWIGGGELESRVKSDLENMNLLSKVEVTGWLQGPEARKRLRDLDIFVHYSRWDGLPNAVLEAMAHGIPVVASDVPGCRDAVVDGETGFLAKTERELLERTLQLVDDPRLRRRLGEAGRRRVQEYFDQKAALARLEALYQGHAG